MSEEKVWHQYMSDAGRTDDVAALRRLIGDCARELHEAEERYSRLDRELQTEDARDRRAALDLRRAQAQRQAVAAKAICALAVLLPKAIQQVKIGKPALLRLILRATK